MSQVMISLKPTFGELVLSGFKTVELRNRIVRIDPGTVMWLYVTSPESSIVGYASVKSVVYGAPSAIWSRFHAGMCIERTLFKTYVGDRVQVSAILLSEVKRLDGPISIGGMRSVDSAFHPPQFYSRIGPESRVYRALNRVFLQKEIPHGLNKRESDQSSWAFHMDRHGSPSADETQDNPVGRRKTHSD